MDPRVTARPLKVEQAYQELKRLIITLELAPGEPIEERELMTRLDFGRTPIREAVLRLAHERLIVHSPRRGAWVSDLSLIDLRQMLEARDVIEPLIARSAAQAIPESETGPLRALIDAGGTAVERDDAERLFDADLAFHVTLAHLCGNVYYASFSEQVHTAMLRYWHFAYQRGHDLKRWRQNHLLLLDAILSHDAERAAGCMQEHIDRFKFRIRQLLF